MPIIAKYAKICASVLTMVAVSACSGAAVTTFMPGEAITVNGNSFTVRETARGVTVQNFETGRTPPAQLLVNAGLAVEQVTGCAVTSITKDGIANTYYANVSCQSGT